MSSKGHTRYIFTVKVYWLYIIIVLLRKQNTLSFTGLKFISPFGCPCGSVLNIVTVFFGSTPLIRSVQSSANVNISLYKPILVISFI